MPDIPRIGQSDRPGSARQPDPPADAAIELPDVVDRSGYTPIPNSVLDDDRLSPETRLVYVMLRRLAATRRGRPIDQREFARVLGIPMNGIPRHLSALERSGRIQLRTRKYPVDPSSIRYRLAEPAAAWSQGRPATTRSARMNLVDRLIVIGVDPQVARDLVASHPEERVAGALRAAHRRRPRPRDPAAWIVAAIQHGWAVQDAAIAAHQRQEAHERAMGAWEQRADAALSALPGETQQSLRRQATEFVETRFSKHLAATTVGAMLITAEVRVA